MPYTIRKAAVKQIKMASGNLDDALQHLLRVKETYEPTHPEVATTVEGVMIVIVKVQALIDNLQGNVI